ncbi:response regulator [Pelomonas sp. P7]|uniref:histidine kinase n=1 Tax=Pelomonas caseinilytica TaxID=2906763 RepID=A0ABS8XCA7_9BURK|nr:hybrid sensor histidine kinase/response regulator [Pelomonas sp. P7]MCE4537335.1 response regulator [Pelomonas sp. P7]
MKAPSPRVHRLSPLERRYALRLCGLTLLLLLVSGVVQMLFSYRESLAQVEELQAVQAESAAREIGGYIAGIEAGLHDIAKLPWGQPGFGLEQRREEFYRLLRLAPAIIELQALDASGREQMMVSRSDPVRLGSRRSADEPALLRVSKEAPLQRGATYFRQAQMPTMRIAAYDGQGSIVATVDLRLLGEVVSRLRIGAGGLAYVVDGAGTLIAHSSATEALGRLDLSDLEPVRKARQAKASPVRLAGLAALDRFHRPVIVTAGEIPGSDWLLFIEQPRSEALKPALATLSGTLVLMLAGGTAALVLGVAFARRMAAPIVALRDTTARIATGQFDAGQPGPMPKLRHDEIEGLAEDFNQMASHLRELYASLEAKVAERTAQLSEARDVLTARADELSRLKDEAERANAAKTRFLAAASHDLRQPMHSISLLLGVLQSRLDRPEHLALAAKIQSSVATMENLFGNLLDISKLDAGAVQAHVEDVDLGWLLHRLEETWAPQAAEKGLRLRVRPCDAVVKGDAALLERIAGNLVANAIRYTRRGGVLVGCRRRDASVELQVWDTGPGIEPRYREAIFEEFFRIEAPGAGPEKGLGLGLSIVQRCAHILGHGLAVDSRVGRGSVFRLAMPLSGTATRTPRLAPLAPAGSPALLGRFIVVVDDEATNAQALVDALRASHCHVVAAASCDEVLAELEQHLRVPDLIVTDYQLGAGRDGFEVIRRLRHHYDDEIAALVVTANTDAALQALAAAHGARLLHKPIGLQRLLEAMQESLASAAAS